MLRTLISLSLVLKSRGHLAGALYQLDEATRLLPARGFPRSRLRIHLNRGVCMLKQGRIAEARASFMQAYESEAAVADAFLSVSVLNNLGHVFRIEGNDRLAIEFHTKALETARKIGSSRQTALSLEFLGECHVDAGRSEIGIDLLNEAEILARRIAGQGDLRMEILRRLGEALAALGRREEASQALERCIHLCRSRGESRELVLAERARLFALEESATPFFAGVRTLLEELRRLGDRYEFVRTFVGACERATPDIHVEESAWLQEAHATAQHFAREMDIPHWMERVRRAGISITHVPTRRDGSEPCGGIQPSKSWAFERAVEAARLAARGNLPVLILGETGSGKEVIAAHIHAWSGRASKPYVAINCGALPEALIESELFGHARGAYTGADRDKVGLLAAADHGVVLLDEVADLPLTAQVKLLRFLDSGEIRRVGETQSKHYDVRVFASTNKSLEKLVDAGRFRDDLLYRLRGFVVEVPPLRDRREDILPLTLAFLRTSSQSTLDFEVSDELQAWLVGYAWPGNVRELRNLCGYLVARAWGDTRVDVRHLPRQLAAASVQRRGASAKYDGERSDLERWQIERALQASDGCIRDAAAMIGMGRNTLARRMRAHGLDAEAFRAKRPRP